MRRVSHLNAQPHRVHARTEILVTYVYTSRRCWSVNAAAGAAEAAVGHPSRANMVRFGYVVASALVITRQPATLYIHIIYSHTRKYARATGF